MSDKEWQKVELAPTWKFEEEGVGATLVGVLIRIESEVGPNKSKLYTLQVEGGETKAVWGSTVLDARLTNLPIGEEIMIKYLGKTKPKGGKQGYHQFDVFHRPAPLPDIEFPTE